MQRICFTLTLALNSIGCVSVEPSSPPAEPKQVLDAEARAPELREMPFDQERLIRAVAQSDDANSHLVMFGGAAQKLVRTGRCTVAEFEEQGGWVRAVSRGAGWYFVYCGGYRSNHRIYFHVHREVIEVSDSR